MTDSTKTGLAVGGGAALIGLVAAFLCYKEGHADGHSEGLAKGGALFKKKYEDLRQKVEEQEKLIKGLQEVKQQVLSDQNVLKATVGELCNNLRGLISDEVYHKIVENLNRTGARGAACIIDETVEELKEGKKAINGSPAKGRIVETKKFSELPHRVMPRPPELQDYNKVSDSKTRIVFSPNIKGWYFWPKFKKSWLFDDKILYECPRLLMRIPELVPGWNFEEREKHTLTKIDYDVMAICSNAMHELQDRVFTCNRVEFNSGRHPSENDRVDIDYENGTVFCKELDEHLTQKCDEVAEVINSFLKLMSNAERMEMEKCRQTLEAISNGEPVMGTLRIVDGTPVICFCRDLNITLENVDKTPLYFEGDGLTVDKNKDLHNLLQKILPAWTDAPISDGRILNIIADAKEDYEKYKEVCRTWGLKWRPSQFRWRSSQLPAHGAVREHLRFMDAGELLRNKILKSYEGKLFTCEYVSLKRKNGFVATESTVRSDGLEKLIGREFEIAQNSLNEFAATRNRRLYSYDDLFPKYADHVYYQKWNKFNRLMEQRRYCVGDVVSGVVRTIKDYGAFVDFDGMSGLLHISNISDEYVGDIHDVLSVGQQVTAKIIKMSDGKIGLSMKKDS